MGKTRTATAKKRKVTPKKKKQIKNSKTELCEKKLDKLDISSKGINFLDVELTPLCKMFLIYYLTPGQPYFQNALQAAIEAGYSPATAKTHIYEILQQPEIQKIVKVNENLIYQELHSSAMRALKAKQIRAFFDPADYFEQKEVVKTSKSGEEYTETVFALKDIKDMTPEQKICIDGIDVKGWASIPMYQMADRSKELNDLIKIDRDLSKSSGNEDGDDETMEIIMERVTVKSTARRAKDAISEIAGLKLIPQGSKAVEL